MDGLFVAALIAGASYWLATELPVPALALIVWKGMGVGLLALWAARRARDTDGWLLAAVLAFGAAGDVLLEAVGLEAGAVAFLIGHAIASILYLRNRRPRSRWLAMLLGLGVAVVAAYLPPDRTAAVGVAFYSLWLGTMAGLALMSRFRLAAVGAWLFVASDLLIFAEQGALAASYVPDLLIWPLYFTGQALIAWGVAQQGDGGGSSDARVHDRI